MFPPVAMVMNPKCLLKGRWVKLPKSAALPLAKVEV